MVVRFLLLFCLGVSVVFAGPKKMKSVKMNISEIAKMYPKLKVEDIRKVDESLKKYGKLGPAVGDFSQGLAYYIEKHNISIDEKPDYFFIGITPKRGNWEFGAHVEKTTGKLTNAYSGSVEANPSE